MRSQNKAGWTVGRRLQQIDNVAVWERIKYLVNLQRLGGIVKETKNVYHRHGERNDNSLKPIATAKLLFIVSLDCSSFVVDVDYM